MSLNRAEMARTAVELQAHLDASGLSVQDVAEWLEMPVLVVTGVLAMDGTGSPSDTWLVRDALDRVTSGSGEAATEVEPWTVLTDEARLKAVGWYSLRRVPPLSSGLAR